MAEQKINYTELLFAKDKTFEENRARIETATNTTIKSQRDSEKVLMLKGIEQISTSNDDYLKLAKDHKAITKSSAKRIGIADLF